MELCLLSILSGFKNPDWVKSGERFKVALVRPAAKMSKLSWVEFHPLLISCLKKVLFTSGASLSKLGSNLLIYSSIHQGKVLH